MKNPLKMLCLSIKQLDLTSPEDAYEERHIDGDEWNELVQLADESLNYILRVEKRKLETTNLPELPADEAVFADVFSADPVVARDALRRANERDEALQRERARLADIVARSRARNEQRKTAKGGDV